MVVCCITLAHNSFYLVTQCSLRHTVRCCESHLMVRCTAFKVQSMSSSPYAFYVRKAVLRRAAAWAGIPARLGEHIRAMVQPAHLDGGRPRYALLKLLGLKAPLFTRRPDALDVIDGRAPPADATASEIATFAT